MKEKISDNLSIDIENNVAECGNRICSIDSTRVTNFLLIEILKELKKGDD